MKVLLFYLGILEFTTLSLICCECRILCLTVPEISSLRVHSMRAGHTHPSPYLPPSPIQLGASFFFFLIPQDQFYCLNILDVWFSLESGQITSNYVLREKCFSLCLS